MFELGVYKTRGDLTVTLFKHTPERSFKYVGYFELRNIRIRIFYNENGDEYFGEKQLDLMGRVYNDGPYVIKPIIDAKKAREYVMGKGVSKS